ncbi:MAG TPA: acyl carrier protein [Lachnospiraceae bacterium]|nr:acyl carrier protein [Lachnospiraceae bacterium]
MTKMIKSEQIVEIIEEVIGVKIDDYSMKPMSKGLDSLAILKLVTFFEDRFGIEIDDEDLTAENMSSVNAIINMVKKYDSEE